MRVADVPGKRKGHDATAQVLRDIASERAAHWAEVADAETLHEGHTSL